MYKAKVAVCSQIRTKHSTLRVYHVQFFNVNLVVLIGALGFKMLT